LALLILAFFILIIIPADAKIIAEQTTTDYNYFLPRTAYPWVKQSFNTTNTTGNINYIDIKFLIYASGNNNQPVMINISNTTFSSSPINIIGQDSLGIKWYRFYFNEVIPLKQNSPYTISYYCPVPGGSHPGSYCSILWYSELNPYNMPNNTEVSADDTLQYSNDSLEGTFSTTYVPLKTISVSSNLTGSSVIRVSFQLECGGAPCTGSAEGRIYKNGVAIGTERSTAGTVTYSEDIMTSLSTTDTLAIYGKRTGGGSTVARIQNFRVYFDNIGGRAYSATGGATVNSDIQFRVSSGSPDIYYPLNGSIITKTYPPLTSSVNFTWEDYINTSASLSYNLLIAKDDNFNLITVNTIVPTNYSIQSIEAGNYWWKLRSYNSTSGTYGTWSDTSNFTLSNQQVVSGTGIQGVVYELIGDTIIPISGATVYLYNNTLSQSMITGSNGYYQFTGLGNSTTYNIYATKQGYDTTTSFPVTTGAGTTITNDILMKVYISPYVPNFVFEKFIVRGLFDNPYPGVTITVYKGDDIIPYLTGTTDSIGSVVFQLIKDQKYRITLSGGGISSTLTYTVYAKEESYLITIISGFPTGGDRFRDINASLLVSTINSTHSNLSLFYNDTRLSTTALNFWVVDLTSNTTVCSQSGAAQTAFYNCTVAATGSYRYAFNATSSIYGTFGQTQIINFDAGKPSSPSIPLTGVSSTLMHWMSIMLIVLTAALFSIRTVKYGAVVVPLMAMVFWAIGWLVVPFLLVSTALVIGILVYVRASEVKAAY